MDNGSVSKEQVDPVDYSSTLTRDRARLRRLWARSAAQPEDSRLLHAFEEAFALSQAALQARALSLPAVDFDAQLPIAQHVEQIKTAIAQHQVIVVAGETGSGKTTQLPKLCLALQRGVAGQVGCTQPRRLAARAVAQRVAEELGEPIGRNVGFSVRFNEHTSDECKIKFMTDGILLAEIAQDRWLSAYDTLIIDEAHERSLNIDFILGYLKQLLKKRHDLKLIITSATIDTESFSHYFDNAPIVLIPGRSYPVDIIYRNPKDLEIDSAQGQEPSLENAVASVIDEITIADKTGDILVFLAGEQEIRQVHRVLERRMYRHTELLPLYARLSFKEQDRVFQVGSLRRIVLATNVAETSLTVPKIRYVIDPGVARIKRYSPRQKLDRLQVEAISQASANQRSGRCGRVASGVCYRLYSQEEFAARPQFTDPEICRSALAGVILRMLYLKLGPIAHFPFLDRPNDRAIADGWQELFELGAIDAQRQLTSVGRTMAALPIDVKLSRMLIAAHQGGCLPQVTVIVSFLAIQDPRERPHDAREAADRAHGQFADARSEFVGILRLWDAFCHIEETASNTARRQWCKKNFLNAQRLREWKLLYKQLCSQCHHLGWQAIDTTTQVAYFFHSAVQTKQSKQRLTRGQLHRAARLAKEQTSTSEEESVKTLAISAQELDQQKQPEVDPRRQAAAYEALHRALLTGLPMHIGQRLEKGDYQAPRSRRFHLFPGSALLASPPRWVLAATVLETQKVWGMMNAVIQPQWAVAELAHLLCRKYFDPRWSPKQGQVIAREQISLFGLVLANQNVHFGRIDAQAAREIFIRFALLTGDITTGASFVARNLEVLAQAQQHEAKLRRIGLVADEQWQLRWYLDRIPAELCSKVGLDAWWSRLPEEKRKTLYWSVADVMPGEGSENARFPPYLAVGEVFLALHYHFEPGATDDGVTLDLPLHLLNCVDSARVSWLTPGFVAEKASALIRSLPKNLRKYCIPAPDFARAFCEAFTQPTADSLEGELARFLTKATGVAIARFDFDTKLLEPYLYMSFRLYAASGTLLETSRDLEALRATFRTEAAQAFVLHAGGGEVGQQSLRHFPLEGVALETQCAGVKAFLGLVDKEQSVDISVFSDKSEALLAHRNGVARLVRITLQDTFKKISAQLPVGVKTALSYASIATQGHLRNDIIEGALATFDHGDLAMVREYQHFVDLCDLIKKQLFARAMERFLLAEKILSSYTEVKPLLETSVIGWAVDNLEDMREQVSRLVYPGFLRDTPQQYLAELPRYLQAIRMRSERAKRDPRKDQSRMLELAPFIKALHSAQKLGKLHQPEWVSLRWDIEELRVSLFAQDLGAKQGISIKKLQHRLDDLCTI